MSDKISPHHLERKAIRICHDGGFEKLAQGRFMDHPAQAIPISSEWLGIMFLMRFVGTGVLVAFLAFAPVLRENSLGSKAPR